MTTRESIQFDVLFVGGGPANLAGAIRLMQLAAENGQELEVAIIDKGAAIGSRIRPPNRVMSRAPGPFIHSALAILTPMATLTSLPGNRRILIPTWRRTANWP